MSGAFRTTNTSSGCLRPRSTATAPVRLVRRDHDIRKPERSALSASEDSIDEVPATAVPRPIELGDEVMVIEENDAPRLLEGTAQRATGGRAGCRRGRRRSTISGRGVARSGESTALLPRTRGDSRRHWLQVAAGNDGSRSRRGARTALGPAGLPLGTDDDDLVAGLLEHDALLPHAPVEGDREVLDQDEDAGHEASVTPSPTPVAPRRASLGEEFCRPLRTWREMAIQPRLSASAGVVPFNDLTRLHAGLRNGIVHDVALLVDSGAFMNGPAVEEFERAFAEFGETNHCVGLASGLDALRLGLIAAGLEPGDEVIVPAMTFVATFEAVTQAAGVPGRRRRRPRRTTASTPRPRRSRRAADARASCPCISTVSSQTCAASARSPSRTDSSLLEDACQAHGARARRSPRGPASSDGRRSASIREEPRRDRRRRRARHDDDADSRRRVRALREHGQRAKYEHVCEGYTARLDTIQALVLLRKLPLLDDWNDAAPRRSGALLRGAGGHRRPPAAAGRPRSEPVWHLYVVRTADPGGLAAVPRERGIGTGRHYPEPPHLTPAFASLGYGQARSRSRRRSRGRCLSLPIFPGITDESSSSSSTRVRAYFAMADPPANDAPFRSARRRRVRRGGRRVASFTNLYGCPIGTGPGSARSSRSSAARSSAPAARSRATVRLRRRRDRATRCSSVTG